MRTTHIKSNVVNNGVPKLPTSDAIYYGEIAINYGASGETLSIKNSNDEIVPFSSDNAINKAFEVHAQSLIDLDGRIVELKETKVESEEFNKIVSDLNQKLSAASESLDNLYSEIVNLTDKINENEVVISESLCDLDKRIKKIDTSYNNPTLTAITFNSIAWVTYVPAAGGTATKDNCSFEVYAKYDNGISVDISSIVTVTGELVIPSSTEGQRHEVGQLTLTASYGGFTATGNVTVYQAAVDFSTKPLTFNILSAGTINWKASNAAITKTIEYKLNDGEWASITSNTGSSAPTIEVNSGDKIQFRGNNTQYATNPSRYNSFSGSTALFEAEGNIMSLIYGDDFKNKLTISSTYAFYGLFRDCAKLVSAENLVLPATTLTSYCYSYMFNGCTSLTTAPELPATTLATYCYQNMFAGCAKLTTAPALPATTLANYCYSHMFSNCTSLATAPALPAIDLANNCYSYMFADCTSLTTAPELPATTLANICYNSMFSNCTSLTTAPALPATTLADSCYNSMFNNCTSLTTAPALPAIDLKNYCYEYMFADCTSLTTAPELPATTLADSCYNSMFNGTNVLPDCSNIDFASSTVVASGGLKGLFSGTKVTDNDLERLLPKNDNGKYYLPVTTLANNCYNSMFWGCTSLTTAPQLPATTLTTQCYYAMFEGCTSLTTAPELPATTLADRCYNSMFYNCTSLTTAPALPATTLANNCYSYMFRGCTSLTTAPALPAIDLKNYCYQNMFADCTSLTTAPELPATTLADSCYQYMFQGCKSLNYIKCLATDISASNCTGHWVYGVASTGTFVKNPNMASWTTGVNGIPEGWTVEDYVDYTKEALTFNIISAGTINWTASNTSIAKTIDYKLNDGEWASITSNTGSSAPTINVAEGDKIQFRGNNRQYSTNYSNYNSFSGSTASFEAEGNIMSLIYGDDFKNKLTISSTYAFADLFKNCTKLVSAKNLVLPATTLANYCYEEMFNNCTSLTTAPELPATALASNCYQYMFGGCTSLTTAPALPATTLAGGCYSGMFNNCTSLTTAPALPATTLANYCYQYMFNGCTKLTTAPALPATTLTNSCYSYMLRNCTSLNYIKCLATDISATDCTKNWVSGVASTGTFVKNPDMASWPTGDNGIPEGWTVQNA